MHQRHKKVEGDHFTANETNFIKNNTCLEAWSQQKSPDYSYKKQCLKNEELKIKNN